MPPEVNNRLDYIDSLRAIAALLVVWMHVSESFIRQPGVAAHGTALFDIARTFDFGRIGVVAFFAISGFIIPQSIKGDLPTGTKKFLIRRFFRLFPAYWLSIPAAFLVLWWIPGREISFGSVLGNFTMLETVLGYQPLMGHYWTLEVELVFYTLCLVLFRMGQIHKMYVCALASAFFVVVFTAASSGLLERWFGFSLEIPGSLAFMSLNLGVMFWGSCCKHCLLDRADPTKWMLLGASSALVFFPPLWALGHITDSNTDNVLRFAGGYGLGMLLFIACVTVLKIRIRALAWLGTLSYSLYLFHPVVFHGLTQAISSYELTALQGLHVGAYLVLASLLSIALAWVVYTLVEKPAIGIGRKLSATK